MLMNPSEQVYRRHRKVAYRAFQYGLILVTLLAHNANAQQRATETVPHPVLNDRLSADDYDARFATAAMAVKEVIQQGRLGRPSVGVIVRTVIEGSPAYELGLREGDLLVRINGVPLWSTDFIGSEQRRSLDFYSVASKKMKTIKLPPGKIGIDTLEYWRPEWTYLQGKSANAKWDAEAIVGITMASSDPDLAETAWNRAVRKGYRPDEYSAAALLEIAFARGDAQRTSEVVAYLRRFEKDNNTIVNPVLLYRVALANGRLDEMRRIVEKYPATIPIDAARIQYLIDLQATNPPLKGESLDSLAKSYLRDNQIPRLLGYWNNDVVSSLPALQQNRPVTLNADPDTRDAILVSPVEPTPNIDISFTFSWEPRVEGNDQFAQSIEVALVDNTDRWFEFYSLGDPRPALVSYAFVQTGSSVNELGIRMRDIRATLEHFPMGSDFRYVDPSIKSAPLKRYAVRLLKIGGHAEMYVDGRPLISVPVDPSIKELMLRVSISSARATIQDFHFDELVEDATK